VVFRAGVSMTISQRRTIQRSTLTGRLTIEFVGSLPV
jgi:hypothetical protein